MGRKWQAKLIQPTNAIEMAVGKAWAKSLKDLDVWIKKDLVNALVNGGFGIQGIRQTPFYNFISSPDGLSQLGIESSDPPRLLDAYKKTFKTSRTGNVLTLQFGDTTSLKMATPHPAAGVGNLHVRSWLELAVDDTQIGRGFVPRERLPENAQKSIRVKSAPGGLMLPRGAFGSTGLWRFPDQFKDFEDKWLSTNVSRIEKAIVDALGRSLTKRLK